jgi:Cu2+-containing amine oxidase
LPICCCWTNLRKFVFVFFFGAEWENLCNKQSFVVTTKEEDDDGRPRLCRCSTGCTIETRQGKSPFFKSEKQQHTKIMNSWRIYHHRFAPAAVLSLLVLLWAGSSSTGTAAAASANTGDSGVTHPLDSLTADEFRTIVDLVTKDERITAHVRFPLVSLKTPPKALVQTWRVGDAIPRSAVAYLKDGTDAYKAEMDLVANTITYFGKAAGQYMVLAEEFAAPTDIVLQSPEFVAGLAARNIRPDQVYCLPYSAGRFGDAIEDNHRLIKVTCDLIPAPATGNGNNITSLLESMKSGNVEGAGLRCRFAIPDGRLQQLDDSSS